MRWWLAFAFAFAFALVGCYRPSESLTCDGVDPCVLPDAATTDSMQGDGPLGDGQGFTTCVDSTFQAAINANVSGTSYSRNVSSLALFIDTDELYQIVSPGAMPVLVAFETPPSAPLTRPVLASTPQGNDVHAFFVQGLSLVRSTRVSGNIWTAPIILSTTGVTMDASFVLGQPTATIPRRALASRNGAAFEAVESGTSWAFNAITIAGVANVLHPSLSNDGLAVVFVSTDVGGLLRLFLAKRATVTSPFEVATPLLDQPTGTAGNEQFPRFGPDCDHIFLSIDTFVVDLG